MAEGRAIGAWCIGRAGRGLGPTNWAYEPRLIRRRSAWAIGPALLYSTLHWSTVSLLLRHRQPWPMRPCEVFRGGHGGSCICGRSRGPVTPVQDSIFQL